MHSEPNYVNYYFEEEDLEGVEAEIANIEESLGDKKQKLDDFFASVNGYNDKDIEALGVTKQELQDYADLGLGIKIRDCIKENGSCEFEAEL
jgi:molybdate-binding protein